MKEGEETGKQMPGVREELECVGYLVWSVGRNRVSKKDREVSKTHYLVLAMLVYFENP